MGRDRERPGVGPSVTALLGWCFGVITALLVQKIHDVIVCRRIWRSIEKANARMQAVEARQKQELLAKVRPYPREWT